MTVSDSDQSTLASSSQRDWKSIFQRVAALLFSLGITAAILFNRDLIDDYAVYGYPSIFIVSMLGNATLILPAPSFLIVFALAGVLNPVGIGVAAGCGAAVGEMTGYIAGISGRGIVEKRPLYQRLEHLMRQWGGWVIFVLALIPNPIFDIGGILAGVLRIPWYYFLAAAAAGKSIRFIIVAYFGEYLLQFF
ncbi:MAG: VTT domain-containing protein [Chloroflexota bacterium]